MKDSHWESMRLDDQRKQAEARPLPHDELVHLQRCTQEARSLLIWLDKEMSWHTRGTCHVFVPPPVLV